jgi:serine/threonine-protein kinase RsbW
MPDTLEATIPATTDGLHRALEMIEHSTAAWNLEPDLIARLRIIVEELVSNTIKYGYGGECAQPIRLRLAAEDAAVRFDYEDDAPPFDPTRWRRTPEPVDLDARPEGQAGIMMVLGLSSDVRYQATPTGNWLTLYFTGPAAAPDPRG